MKPNFVYRHIVGDEKGNPADFPKNRKQLGINILKHHFSKIIVLSVWIALGFLPLFALEFFALFYFQYAKEAIPNIDLKFLQWILLSAKSIFSIPLLFVALYPISGALHILRKLCWGEGIFIFSDMKEGMQKKAKQHLVMALLLGGSNFIYQFNTAYFRYDTTIPPFLTIFLQGVMIVQWIFFLISTIFLLLQAEFYRFETKKALKNSFLCCIRFLPKNIAIVLLPFFPILLCFTFFHIWINTLLFLFCILFYFAFYLLGITLYGLHIFDRVFHQTHQPDIVNKGLYK